MNEQDIQKLREAGYSDSDIRDYMANQPRTAPGATQTQVETLPEVDVTKPSEILRTAEAQGQPTGARESSLIGDLATAAAIKGGQFAVENPLATTALGLYGASYIPGVNRLPVISGIRDTRLAVSDIAQRAMERAKPPTPGPAPLGSPSNPIGGSGAGPSAGRAPVRIPVTAPQAPVAPQILDAAGRPMAPSAPSAPIAPQTVPPAAPTTPQPSILDRTTAMIRQLAANKVVQGMAKGGAGLTAALMPGNVGQNYNWPQSGPLKGYEINPMTQLPWKPEELAAYNANPEYFSQQVAQRRALMPR